MFEDLVKTYENLMEKVKKESEVLGVKLQKELKAFPEVKHLIWAQYTPYFNDGDECRFYVHEPHVLLRTTSRDTDFYDLPGSYSDKISPKLKEFLIEFAKLPNDLFKMAFGDHVKVTVSNESIDVEEYEHE